MNDRGNAYHIHRAMGTKSIRLVRWQTARSKRSKHCVPLVAHGSANAISKGPYFFVVTRPMCECMCCWLDKTSLHAPSTCTAPYTRAVRLTDPLPPLRLCASDGASTLVLPADFQGSTIYMICRFNSVTGVSWSGIRVRVQLIGHL